jgi:hydroxymethylpyrimidine pyrophosphatase-like HAD family hydrolase
MAETLMKPEPVRAFAHFIRSWAPAVGVRISTSSGFLADSEDTNPLIQRDMKGAHRRQNALLLPMSQWPLEEVKLYKMVVRGAPEVLTAVRRDLENHFGTLFSYTSSSPAFLEVQAGGCTKGIGLASLAAQVELRTGRKPLTLAAGNHENDLPMLKAADLAACPSDALEDIKPFCRYILCPYAEGCIADLIDRL